MRERARATRRRRSEIPIASLRELADLVLRSELVAVSHQVLHGQPEFALRRVSFLVVSWCVGEIVGAVLGGLTRPWSR